MQLSTRSDIMALIEHARDDLGVTERSLCISAGVSPNTITNLRLMRHRGVQWATAVALIEACGYRLVAVPEC